ncbi:MAG: alpha/beta fold hydrolase [Flavobacteriales bacterium]|nr:alpha/beta fold hydrolase [Flavobacteriales bacterium]
MSILKEMERHGSYAQLSQGKVRYELSGPENGELVVLVHGFMGHLHVWDHQAKFLLENGYRVLRFDLYGRGFSDRVRGEHGSELFQSQLTDLFNFLNINEKFHLVGLSMGGAISTRFTSHHPEKVKSLFLVDCYGIPMPEDPGIRIVQPKLFGEALIGMFGGLILRNAPIKGIYDKKEHGGFTKWFSAPLAIKGSKRALLSTLRNFMLENHVPHYERLNHLDLPKLILWGEEDQVLPIEYGRKIQALVPNAEFVTIEKCGHVPQYETPEKFNQIMLQFLKREL